MFLIEAIKHVNKWMPRLPDAFSLSGIAYFSFRLSNVWSTPAPDRPRDGLEGAKERSNEKTLCAYLFMPDDYFPIFLCSENSEAATSR